MIESDLLSLTPLCKDDWQLYKDIYTDPVLWELVGEPLTEKSAQQFFNQSVEQFSKDDPTYLFYVINNRINNNKIGIVGIIWNQAEKTGIEMGVMISKTALSQGYAIKALKLLINHAFQHLNIKTMVAFCNDNNYAANRVSKALGYQNVGEIIEPQSNQKKFKWELTIERFNSRKKR